MEEEKAIRLIEYTTDMCTRFIRLMAEAGADMVSNGDSPAGPSMISPDMYERFAFPYEQRMLEEAHLQGVPYLLHICGNTDRILQSLATMNLDAVELDYKTQVESICKFLGNHTTLFGTVDPSGVMALGTTDDVRRETQKILDIYSGNPRLVIGAGCAIPPIAPEENIRTIIQTAHEVEM